MHETCTVLWFSLFLKLDSFQNGSFLNDSITKLSKLVSTLALRNNLIIHKCLIKTYPKEEKKVLGARWKLRNTKMLTSTCIAGNLKEIYRDLRNPPTPIR